MGIVIEVPPNVFTDGLATTPTAPLTAESLTRAASLPGRAQPGFVGGTAIINGETSAAGFKALDLFVEASETVMIGRVTANTSSTTGIYPCTIDVEYVPLVFSEDDRMPFGDAINGSGFNVDPCSVAVGNIVAGEGYYGANSADGPGDRKFHIFAFESDDAALLNEFSEITKISRASCRTGRSIEVRGSSTYILPGTANVFDANILIGEPPKWLGSAALVVDALTSTSIYRIRNNIGSCPQNIYVETWDDMGNVISTTFPELTPVDIK